MFPGLRQRLDAALDLLIEFSTLGEYGLAAPAPGGGASAPHAACDRVPRLGGAGHVAARAADRQEVAGGAVASQRSPASGLPRMGAAATPAARRLALAAGPRRRPTAPPPARRRRPLERRGQPLQRPYAGRTRGGAAEAPEQLCLAV
jgi:hypothetical protein